jgi:hypothetical protein
MSALNHALRDGNVPAVLYTVGGADCAEGVIADRRERERAFPVLRDARRHDIGVQILFEPVMAAHFIDLAAFLMQAQPPALFERELVFHVQPHDRRDRVRRVRRDDLPRHQPVKEHSDAGQVLLDTTPEYLT